MSSAEHMACSSTEHPSALVSPRGELGHAVSRHRHTAGLDLLHIGVLHTHSAVGGTASAKKIRPNSNCSTCDWDLIWK